MQNGVALDVNPIVCLCWLVAPQAVLLEIGGYLFIRRVGLEESPAPSVAPQRVVGKAALRVLDQDKPYVGLGSPVCISGCQLCMVRCIDLLDQHGAIGEFLVAAIVFGG